MSLTTQDQIEDATRALPDTVAKIAELLESVGVQGTCGSPSRCALAEYFLGLVEVPEDFGLVVGSTNVSIWPLGPSSLGAIVVRFDDVLSMDHAMVVSEFITAFDANRFPGLVLASA